MVFLGGFWGNFGNFGEFCGAFGLFEIFGVGIIRFPCGFAWFVWGWYNTVFLGLV